MTMIVSVSRHYGFHTIRTTQPRVISRHVAQRRKEGGHITRFTRFGGKYLEIWFNDGQQTLFWFV